MVTDNKELNITEYKDLYSQILENIHYSIFLLTNEGKILDCNDTAVRFLSYKKEYLIEKAFLDFIKIPLGFYSTSENNFNLVSDENLDKSYEFSYIKRDRSISWLSTKISKIKIRKITYYLIVCEDITERKNLELNSKLTEKNLEEIYEILINGINIYHVIDRGRDFIFKENILTSNGNSNEKETIIGYGILEIFPYTIRYEVFRKFQQVYKTGKPEIVLTNLKNIDKKEGRPSEFHIFRLSPNEIITVFNNPPERFDLKKNLGSFKDLFIQVRLNDKILHKKSFYSTVLNSILSRFIGTIDFDISVEGALKDLCKAVDGSRSFLFLFDQNQKYMFNTHEWCDEGIESHQHQFKKVLISQFPWSMKQIFKGKYVNINNLTNLPSEAETLKKILEMNGIKSNIFLPIYIGGNIGGFIGIDNELRQRNWDNEDINLLQICSQIVGNAFERKNFEIKLKLSEKKYRSLFNKSTHLFALINLKGEIIDLNDTALNFLEFKKDEIIGKHFKDIIPISQNNFAILKNSFKDLILKGSIEPIELQIHNDDIKLQWINLEANLIELSPEPIIQVIIQDISKRKTLEQMLIDKGQQYRNILESITDAIHVINKDSQIIYLNPTFSDWLKELNLSSEILGKKVRESFPFLPEKIEKEYQRVFDTGKTVNSIDFSNFNDNTLITETQKIPIITNGKVDQIITIVRDVTVSVNAQNKIKVSEEKYRSLFKDSPLPILLIDLNGMILDGNPAIRNHFGYNVSEFIGQDLKKFKFVPTLHLPKVLKLYKKLINNETTEPIEIQIYTANGILKWIRCQVSIVDVNNSEVIQIIVQDLEDIKQSKFKMLESEIKYNDVLENINEGFFEVDIYGNLQTSNNALCRNIGYSKEELMNKHFSFLFDDENKKKIYRKYKELYEKGEGSILFDYEIKNKDGAKSHHESSVYLKYDHHGKIIGFRGLIRDISERKKAEALRDKFKEKLEKEVKIRTNELNEVLLQQKLYLDQIVKASNFKTDFLSTMSHELRTPLNAIIGFTDLLLEGYYGELNKDQREFIKDIEESSNHLLDMITNILDISKIESGEIALKIDEVRLAVIVNNVRSTLQPLYNKKHLLVNIKGLKDDILINADKIKLKQIIYNLLSNAIKFTERGTINIEFKQKSDYWEFKIKDTGIGIAEEDYDVIFRDFKRVNSPYVNSIPGSGLGLALTKRLVELHGGNISFTSKLGKGTTFKFVIPNEVKNKKVNYGIEGFLKLL